ncbi:MAG: threonine/serine dehydratase [Acidobacteriota bacterium]
MELSFDLISKARPQVEKRAWRTPLESSPELSRISGKEVYLKCENLQRTGSFKIRGATAKMALLTETEKRQGVIAASAGNHGQAVAIIAREMGIEATIHVPALIPRNKLDGMKRFGAQVIVSSSEGYDDTEREAMAAAAKENKVWISPYDDPWIMAGAGTIGCEILEELGDSPRLDALVIPVGGGGLAIGVGVAARALCPSTRILGVNTSASPGLYLSRKEGRARLSLEPQPTIAEGLEGGVSERAFALSNRFIDDMLLVEEASLPRSIALVLKHHHFAIEGSAAVAVAAVLNGLVEARYRRIAVILSGANIDYMRLRKIVLGNPLESEPPS